MEAKAVAALARRGASGPALQVPAAIVAIFRSCHRVGADLVLFTAGSFGLQPSPMCFAADVVPSYICRTSVLPLLVLR
jgi:hypothetical protein